MIGSRKWLYALSSFVLLMTLVCFTFFPDRVGAAAPAAKLSGPFVQSTGHCTLRTGRVTLYELDSKTTTFQATAQTTQKIKSVGVIIDPSDETAQITADGQPLALRVDGRMGKLYLVEFAQPKSVINFVTQNVARPWVIVVVEGVTDLRWPGESLNWLATGGYTASHAEQFVTPFSGLVESCIANVDNDLDDRPMSYALRVNGPITTTLNRAGGNVSESDLISLTVKSKVGDTGSIEVVSPLTKDEDANTDGDNNPATTPTDRDHDGIPDYLDPDDDGPGPGDSDHDGVPDNKEDPNGDGRPTNDDTDGDHRPNYLDPDDDGDGIPTKNEDINGDGDPTNDDIDGDGKPNYLDNDDDSDGFKTDLEDTNTDGDGNPATHPDDKDGDHIPDHLDRDDGGPGPGDSDGDGLTDEKEDPNGDSNPVNDDTDQDGLPNYMDADDDNDGTPTADEDNNADNDPTNDDLDSDEIPSYLDRQEVWAATLFLPLVQVTALPFLPGQ